MITIGTLRQRQSLPLEQKIIISKRRIKAWHEHYDGDVCVSFSGGMDSTVLLHLVRSMYDDVPAFFVNTGLEYPEIVQHVKQTKNVQIVRPRKSFSQVIEQYGYPVVSKRQAQYLHELQNAKGETATKRLRLTGIKSNGEYSKLGMISKKWQYLVEAPFKISDRCCHWLKKKPLLQCTKKRGLYPFVGTRTAESMSRERVYIANGCNAFHIKSPRSTPLAFWLNSDIWEYVQHFDVPYSLIYDMGYTSTGCMFCMFGVHCERQPNRFQRMEITHPKQYKFCIEKLGLGTVLDYLNVPYTFPQTDFLDICGDVCR